MYVMTVMVECKHELYCTFHYQQHRKCAQNLSDSFLQKRSLDEFTAPILWKDFE
jgi:hypothetical protein